MHLVHLICDHRNRMVCIMNLARIRSERGMTQRDLAEMVGLDQSTIQRAEKMHKSARLETYTRCAEALKITLSDIFVEDRSSAEMKVLRAFRAMDTHWQKAWIDIAEGVLSGQSAAETPETADHPSGASSQ